VTWLHRAPAHRKLLALLAFVLVVVALPPHWFAAYAVALAVVVGVAASARVGPLHLLRRSVVELPFVVFAVVLPFVATGPRIEPAWLGGLSVSETGLLAAFALLAKGTLGVLASVVLAATTPPHALLEGLARLRMPAQLVSIMGFMARYLVVVTDELRRMKVARESRGFDARDPRQWPVLARTLGVLFVRSYERGERVHLAVLSRGGDGEAPPVGRTA